jgi:SnoaL-like domain
VIAGTSTNDEAGTLLEHVVSLYNAGVRTGDFGALVALFTDDGVLEIEGTERGPVTGRTAIREHFEDEPPDDGIRIKRWKQSPSEIAAEFGWTDIPEGGGCLFIAPREGRVARLTIALGGPRCRFR